MNSCESISYLNEIMHPLFTNSSNVPAFLIKLWKLVGDPSTNDLISWKHNGSSFIISDSEQFARDILPQYFKHNNIASFIRQLNMYGFRKVMNYGKANDSQELEFQHPFFSRDKVELLANIKRKIAASKIVENGTNHGSNDILTNLSTLKEKQRVMDTTLTKMKKENELLWRELSTVRQRHKAQEQVLQKVIQFLVQIIQRSNQSIHVPRKLARMLQDSSVSQENSTQVARIIDVLRNKDSDCIIVPDEADKSPVGAVIHEVTDFEPESSSNPQASSVAKFNSSVHKTFSNGNKNSTFSIASENNSTTSTLEPLNILENLQNRPSSLQLTSTAEETSAGVPVKYVALPIEGEPDKLVLVPAENFSSQEISNFKEDSFCNIIALPEKESNSAGNTFSLAKILSNSDTTKNKMNINPSIKSNSMFEKPDYSSSVTNIVPGMSSKQVPNDFSLLKKDLDDLVLSDLLQASKISTQEEECDDKFISDMNSEERIIESAMEADSVGIQASLENCNNQVAIPGPSSLVKSTKNCYSDFNILQDSTDSTLGIDVKVLEQLFSSDEAINYESLLNQLQDDKDIHMASDDIMGNEIVQFTPAVLDSKEDPDQFFEFLNQESYNLDSVLGNNFYCGPKDTDVLITSSDSTFPSLLETVKKETALTPMRRPYKNSKNNKRRKM